MLCDVILPHPMFELEGNGHITSSLDTMQRYGNPGITDTIGYTSKSGAIRRKGKDGEWTATYLAGICV